MYSPTLPLPPPIKWSNRKYVKLYLLPTDDLATMWSYNFSPRADRLAGVLHRPPWLCSGFGSFPNSISLEIAVAPDLTNASYLAWTSSSTTPPDFWFDFVISFVSSLIEELRLFEFVYMLNRSSFFANSAKGVDLDLSSTLMFCPNFRAPASFLFSSYFTSGFFSWALLA